VRVHQDSSLDAREEYLIAQRVKEVASAEKGCDNVALLAAL
jgi:hypothetical protein